ncbi:unnamed protein product [Adineta ricciae]|uniref:PhoD-like phosphatase domain-containing protein n=1 Tax=Adineta ricciae TaxID=249248 RepID=A0A814RD80_ADIRI|nr:unnamed protein product [Adineta ricciae]CAF1413501.1 unnamed protein product [Adineta ricciae]
MAHDKSKSAENEILDKHGDLEVNAPNPINVDPQFMGDYPLPKATTSKIPQMAPPTKATTDSAAVNRPPKPPGPALGPYFHFLTTDLTKMLWMGSALIFHHISYPRPKMEFTSDVKVDYNWEVLYENIFDFSAYRINISIELRPGEGDDKVTWEVDWGEQTTNGSFLIARCDQNWRGGFFSCNGFDSSVPERVASDLTYSNVWNHLLSVHEETPLHLLIWGGDQNYIDFIFEDIPFLRAWVNMDWNEKWITDFRDDLREQVEQYHFYTYAENWERRHEVKRALSSIPSVMMWDDHDIFDGAGSYPPLLHDSPMMMGLFLAAQKMRLLFQHHTTFDRARDHQLFGYQGYNFFARCGRHIAILGADGRTERDVKTVHHPKTWDMIFDRLENDLDGVEHLVVVFPVPFSFIRFHVAESVTERVKNFPNKWRNTRLIKKSNSIFNLPEFYDDLLDEWIHHEHIEERNQVLARFQQLAEKKKVRITYFSGDVHCCGVGRFQSMEPDRPAPVNDAKLMYQIISSAIVNMPPSRMAIRAYHLFNTHWNPVDRTEEEIISFFERRPENARKVIHRKLRPNRNWCYFERISNPNSSAVTVVRKHGLRIHSSRKHHVLPINLGATSNKEGEGSQKPPIHVHSHHGRCHERINEDEQQLGDDVLHIQLWLESARKRRQGRRFNSYNLLIPNLK